MNMAIGGANNNMCFGYARQVAQHDPSLFGNYLVEAASMVSTYYSQINMTPGGLIACLNRQFDCQ